MHRSLAQKLVAKVKWGQPLRWLQVDYARFLAERLSKLKTQRRLRLNIISV